MKTELIKLLKSKKFNIKSTKLPVDKFSETVESLSPYARFLFISTILAHSKHNGSTLYDYLNPYYEDNETKKINESFFLDNVNKNSNLLHEWWIELIDKGLIEINPLNQDT